MNEIMKQITSPFIHSFRFNVGRRHSASWVEWPYTCGDIDIYTLPSVIFQTESLVSIELSSGYGHGLELPRDSDNINLLNLKNLNQNLKCSNQNLRRLLIKSYFINSDGVVIKAPKLEYLDISAPLTWTYSFEEEPIALREAKIKSNYEANALFFEAISNVRFLTLDISNPKLDNLSVVFRNATRLTLDMNVTRTLKTLLSILEMYPVLDVLTLNVMDIGKDSKQSLCPQPANVSPLRQSLRRININISNWVYTYCKPAKSFLDLVAYLLRNTLNLEQFNLSAQGCQNMERKQVRELKLCELLYRCPMVSKGCDVEFKGRYFKMSGKDGPKAWLPDGKVIHSCGSPLK